MMLGGIKQKPINIEGTQIGKIIMFGEIEFGKGESHYIANFIRIFKLSLFMLLGWKVGIIIIF